MSASLRVTIRTAAPVRKKPATGDTRVTKAHGFQIRIPKRIYDDRGKPIGFDCTGGRQQYEWQKPEELRGTSYEHLLRRADIVDLMKKFEECIMSQSDKFREQRPIEQEVADKICVKPIPEGKSPVELEVWYGSMPESNGKHNYTAILKRKDASLLDGDEYTFQRSEYPDRVRYEADFMRYLIGETAERPDILAYDADKHSGYIDIHAKTLRQENEQLRFALKSILEMSVKGHQLQDRMQFSDVGRGLLATARAALKGGGA